MDRRGRRPDSLDLERGDNQSEGVPTPRRSARLAQTPLRDVHPALPNTPRQGNSPALPNTPRQSNSPALPSGGRLPPRQDAIDLTTPPASNLTTRTTPEEVEAESVPPPPSSSSSGSSNVTSIRELAKDATKISMLVV
ncbi:hypothetical protein BDW59DRAFT_168181 [Aspergillus cavernicola]|uniref:Uncharacterized protein n=1 Tax=Aspergillus cavernicola TaxID=176166 RepID=A0ABR4H3M4_9EURO